MAVLRERRELAATQEVRSKHSRFKRYEDDCAVTRLAISIAVFKGNAEFNLERRVFSALLEEEPRDWQGGRAWCGSGRSF